MINFITRKDYQGLDISVYALGTQEGGADKKTLTVSGGFGDLAKDRFNVFASGDFQKLGALRSSQREFIQEYSLPDRLPPQLSSNPFPANVDLTAAQLATLNAFVLANPNTALKGTGPNGTWAPAVPGSSARRVNFAKSSCTGGANPNSVSPTSLGGREGCAYNYMGNTEIYPEGQKANLITRATLQVTDDHQLFAEALFSQSRDRLLGLAGHVGQPGHQPGHHPAGLAAGRHRHHHAGGLPLPPGGRGLPHQPR